MLHSAFVLLHVAFPLLYVCFPLLYAGFPLLYAGFPLLYVTFPLLHVTFPLLHVSFPLLHVSYVFYLLKSRASPTSFLAYFQYLFHRQCFAIRNQPPLFKLCNNFYYGKTIIMIWKYFMG
ncbi:MAG: hypothetical protein U1C59_10190, partial [Methylotenera sp.]|nr:hypothetical protein [Methylotenera sp.]